MRYKILIIDDSADEVENVLDSYKHDTVYEIQHTTDGREGLKLAEAKPPDAIILDIRMKPMDGYEVLRRLQANVRTKRIPVIIFSITGQDHDEDRKIQAIMLGADYYLAKKEDLRELRACVDRAVERSHSEVAIRIQEKDHYLEISDSLCRQVNKDGVIVDLPKRVSEVLYLLYKRRGEILTIDEIGKELFRDTWEPANVYRLIDRLRRKIEPDFHKPIFVLDVRGQGFKLTPGA